MKFIKRKILKRKKGIEKAQTADQLMKGKKSGKVFLTKEGEKLLNKWK
ncbi:MAG: hypothetical protein LRY73_18205 [Bacillus sp. (in: Bacteria)]|nr:hypothetical protein [Bacillus sp. (in: firmicutes)]